MAESGQFVFIKETSRDRNVYRAKLLAARNSPLKLYQANWGQLPRSLEDGGPGLCGIIANMFPELVDAYCNSETLSLPGRESLHAILSDVLACVTERHYPATMKYLLRRRGLPIHTISRMNGVRDIDEEDARRLDEMLGELDLLRQPNEIVASVVNRIDETGHVGLRRPHRQISWASRASTAADRNEFD